ncbi:MAG: beta-Ala-His dipeptidase [Lachnospiraceae bacterium]|nr:beta-Ala-His dipeptidase [Lachnospiraceae bacterium]
MSVLEGIEPVRVMHYFEQISAIPRGSRNTRAISDHLVNFARERGLEVRQDEVGNVVIHKPASSGMEDHVPVIIQGHMDMVCEKTADCPIDMMTEGLKLKVADGKVMAEGTTLGADDGIAVAMALAILEDDSVTAPPLEVVITVDEEIGMLGAAALDMSDIRGRRLLNIDSEEEGVFTVSCAGGATAICSVKTESEVLTGDCYRIDIHGLTGGHSGIEIDKNRANAAVLLGRLLGRLGEGVTLKSAKSGNKDNAIPNSAEAEVMLTGITEDILCRTVDSFLKDIDEEYGLTDAGIRIDVTSLGKAEAECLTSDSFEKAVYMLNCLPNGIIRRSPANVGFVRTSLNLGIFTADTKSIRASFCVRSSVKSEKQQLLDTLRLAMRSIGGDVQVEGDYPGWIYRKNSELEKVCVEVYTEQYGHKPEVEAVHAGLECGYFVSGIEGLECISFGPDLNEIHTVRETMDIESVQRVYRMLLGILKRL